MLHEAIPNIMFGGKNITTITVTFSQVSSDGEFRLTLIIVSKVKPDGRVLFSKVVPSNLNIKWLRLILPYSSVKWSTQYIY